MKQMQNLGRNTISGRIMNQVGTALPNGSANKEFIPTMGGNYIIWNNFDNTVQGNIPSTIGYNGSIEKICTPAFMPGPYEEGQTWSVDYWFNFRNSTMNSILSKYPKFFNLLDQAGFVNTSSKSIRFLDNNENYTVFAPSDEALNDYQVDTLSTVELEKFLKYHFLQGKMIFTDNKQFSDVYNTVGNVTLNIRTSPDMIEILNREGSTYVSIPEKEGVTNIMVSQGSVVTSVVHEIDQVLVY
jgi:uncharacterized surface protein with fasciclin (FAS1) repeats